MSEVAETEVVAQEAVKINHYCLVCGGVCVRGEWEDMTGWLCTEPDCGFFEFD